MRDKAYQRVINAWCMYDWANSAFATTIMAAVLPTYYSAVAAANLPGNRATVYWGYTSSIALLITAAMGPVLGAMADHLGAKKRFLASFAAFGIFFTSLLVLVGQGQWLLALVLYVLGEIGLVEPMLCMIRSCRTSPARKTSTTCHRRAMRWGI